MKHKSMIWSLKYFAGLIICFCLSVQADARKEWHMAELKVSVDGKSIDVPVAHQGDEIFVALDDFCAEVNAEAKTLEDGGPLAVCREDLCIPLNVSGTEDTLTVDGVLFGRLAAFGEPLGLSWAQNNGSLAVISGQAVSGLGIGNTPPSFTIPDLYTGASVSPSDYLGKKTVFYMWASW
ncbi:MAG: hypothetical protein ACI8V2_001930 [Candidatus Latescibacterota bacterium]|jgi:hypothetical protein